MDKKEIPSVLTVDEMKTHFKLGREQLDKHIGNGMSFFLTDPDNPNSNKRFIRSKVMAYLDTLRVKTESPKRKH